VCLPFPLSGFLWTLLIREHQVFSDLFYSLGQVLPGIHFQIVHLLLYSMPLYSKRYATLRDSDLTGKNEPLCHHTWLAQLLLDPGVLINNHEVELGLFIPERE